MSADPPVLSTTHLVAHCLREIESALRDVLEPVVENEDGPEDQSKPRTRSSTHEAEIRAILRGLGVPETDPVAEAWLKLPGRDSTYNLAGRAHRNSLDRPRPLDPEFRRLWDDIQNVLDTVLDRFEARYSDSHGLLDELLAKSIPARSDLRRLKDHAPNNSVSYRYFFDRLESVGWLQPLRDEGFFRSPPEPEQDYEQGGFRFVGWPQSTYLERMVDVDPETVKEIIQELPPTGNVRVYEELAGIAGKLPAHMTAELVPKLKEWTGHPVQWVLPEKMSDLVERLARGGRTDEALELARELFAVLPHDRYGGRSEQALPAVYEPRTRFEDFFYAEYLGRCSTVLAQTARERALATLCDLLEDALRISTGPHEGAASGDHPYEDPLHVSRPAIDHDDQDQLDGPETSLVSAMRNVADYLAEKEPESLPRMVQMLEERRWRTFDRLALYLLWRFPDAAPELVAERLTDRRRFDDSGLRREYALLARSNFARLDAQDQAIILGWIEEGPDLEEWRNRDEEFTGQRPTDEEAARYARRWRRDRLSLLGTDLPPEWKERYNALVEELGQPEPPESGAYTITSWVGPESPRTAEDLAAMTADDIVAYLKTWRPPGAFMGPSPDGLARELAGVVAQDPERFVQASSSFRDLDPTYVRGLINGLRDAAKQGHVFSWSPVLDLCLWVVRQSREIPGRREEHRDLIEHHDLDPDWGWTRKAIADLLEEGFKNDGASMPPELRERAWAILLPLTDDPEPDTEYEERYGGSNMDPVTLSLNTVRSQAMHAVMRYALWVREHLREAAGAEEGLARGFDEMPEVRSVLEDHLDPERDPSAAVRAVYGWWFPQLTLLDESWATENVAKIFPTQEPLRGLRRAAWGAYVVVQRPYDSVFEILRGEYEHAIQGLGFDSGERWLSAQPGERLVWHLMALFWRGKLDPEDPKDSLAQFYDVAPDHLRAHAVQFLTRQLRNPEVEASEEVLTRLRALWEMRLRSMPEAAPDHRARELGAFAELVATGKFDKRWALEQLNEVVALGGQVDLDRGVIDYLADCASDMPSLVVRCLEGLIEETREEWRIFATRDSIREILTAAAQSSDADPQRGAREVANRLVARGYSDFQDLT
jgi:hypothetical protein